MLYAIDTKSKKKGIEYQDLVILEHLRAYADGNKIFWGKLEEIGNELNLGKGQVFTSLKRMERAGLIIRATVNPPSIKIKEGI